MRYGGVLSLGSAYAGTSNPQAIKKLLHITAIETQPDVSKIACSMLGLIMIFDKESLVELIELNLQS